MRSIKQKSDLAKVIEFLIGGIDLNTETTKKFPGNSNFPSYKSEDQSTFETEKAERESKNLYIEDEQPGYYGERTSSKRKSDDDLKNRGQAWQDDIGQSMTSADENMDSYYSNRKFSKHVSRERLKEAIIWSEILGPPASKRRDRDNAKINRYKQ